MNQSNSLRNYVRSRRRPVFNTAGLGNTVETVEPVGTGDKTTPRNTTFIHLSSADTESTNTVTTGEERQGGGPDCHGQQNSELCHYLIRPGRVPGVYRVYI